MTYKRPIVYVSGKQMLLSRPAAQTINAKLSPHIQAAFEKIDRDTDPWFLPNWKISILGDARIYVDNPRIRDSALTAIGIKARVHLTVREALRGKLTCERRDAVAFRRYASMLIGERMLAREGAQEIAAKFAARAA